MSFAIVCLSAFAQTGKDIVDVASGSANHTTLVADLKAADWVETLKSEEPYTVFAPSNAAFKKTTGWHC